MYCQIIKVQCKPGDEAKTGQSLDRYLQAAGYNPGFIHGSWFVPEALPGGDTPSGFSIRKREQTFFVYLAFRSPRDMLKHVELYHDEEQNLLPIPHDYLIGAYSETTDVEVVNLYTEPRS